MSHESIRLYRLHEHGGPQNLTLESAALPEPGPGEVRVRLAAMALNHLDLWVRRGIPGVRFPLPLIPGSDGAGVVDAIGPGVETVEEGSEVFVLPATSCGSCRWCLAGEDNLCASYGILGEGLDGVASEARVLPAVNVAPKPANLSFVEAAAFPLTFMTAWQMAVRKGRIRPGDRVLVHAAASGVSIAAIQLASLFGARVATTAGSEEKLELGRELGAELAVNYREEDWQREVKSWAGESGVDVVLDHVGEDTFAPSMRLLARGGRYVFCGATSGFTLKTDFRPVFFKNQEILGSTMGHKRDLLRIAELFESGRLRSVVAQVYSFDELPKAHALLEERGALGKVVVRVG